MSAPDCVCLASREVAYDELLQVFTSLRKSCPALQLLVPDALWPTFSAWDAVGDDDAFHRSIALLALDRGCLGQLTGPIHRFLLDGNQPRPDLRRQYIRDLREDWLFEADPFERHGRSRIYMGRVTELQIATWLESQGWSITGLDALRKGPDIEAVRDSAGHAFEVKAIGTQDAAFGAVLQSLRNQPGAARWVSLEGAANFALFRAYECACQLRRVQARRVAVLAIDGMTWHNYEPSLNDNWIDWTRPAFLPADQEWDVFLAEQEHGRYPEIRTDLAPAIASMDEVWIFQRREGFVYERERLVEL